MDARLVRSIAKKIGLNADNRHEISRILQDDDYSSPFPISGPVTFAIAVVLIDIIEECRLPMQRTLPLALLQVDPQLPSVTAPGSVKRACERRLKHGNNLYERIDSLYHPDDDSLGPFCSKLGINRAWLHDHHHYELAPGTVITNGAVLELFQYFKTDPQLTWEHVRQWLTKMYPDVEQVSSKTLATDWKRLQAKKNKAKKNKVHQELLDLEYKLPQLKPLPLVAIEPEQPEDIQGTSTCRPTQTVEEDIYHKTYDSPTKQKLVQHIVQQDAEIKRLVAELESHQSRFSGLQKQYDTLFGEHNTSDERTDLRKQLALLEESEKDLLDDIKDLTKQYNVYNVNKKLKYREIKIDKLEGFIESYKETLATERAEMKAVVKKYELEKSKKRNEQRRIWYYKSKATPLENMKEAEIRHLLKESDNLRYQIDDLYIENSFILPRSACLFLFWLCLDTQ